MVCMWFVGRNFDVSPNLESNPKEPLVSCGFSIPRDAVTFSIIRPLPNLQFLREVSDWSIVIISTLPNSLTGSRGEYLRVVGIHSDG